MRHRMQAETEYYCAVKDGRKKNEIPLADKKRRNLAMRVSIKDSPLKRKIQTLLVNSTSLEYFTSFREIYKDLDWMRAGRGHLIIEEILEQTYGNYSPVAEEKLGVLASGIQ